jgi:hypothetical protein
MELILELSGFTGSSPADSGATPDRKLGVIDPLRPDGAVPEERANQARPRAGMTYYLKNPSGAKLDAYFGTRSGATLHNTPRLADHALLRLYERQLERKIGKPKGVGPTRRALLYHRIFASKRWFGIDLWNRTNTRSGYLGI